MKRKLKLLSILEYLLDFEFDYGNYLNYERVTIYPDEKNYYMLIYSKTKDIFYIYDVDEEEKFPISYDELLELAREPKRLIARLSETVLLD